MLEPVDERLWDRLQQKLPAPRAALELTLVAIDDATLAQLPPPASPGDPLVGRDQYARALERLGELGARLVVLDVFFEAPRDPAQDARLGAAIRAAGALVPCELSPTARLRGGTLEARFVPRPPAASLGVPEAQQGFANLPVQANPGGVYRRVWLSRRTDDGVRLSLGARLAERLGVAVPAVPEALERLDFRPLRPPGRVAVVPLVELLEGRTPRDLVAGRVCLLGATAARLGDLKDTPLGTLPGALVHATVAENLAGGRLVRCPGGLLAGLLALPALALGMALPPALWPLAGLGTCLGTLLLAVLGAALGIFVPAATPLVAGLVLLGAGVAGTLIAGNPRGARVWTRETARLALDEASEAGDARRVRLLVAEFDGELQADPEVRAAHARALCRDGRDGPLRKVLEGHEGWALAPAQRDRLARDLEAEGHIELALEQLEVLYRQDAGGDDVGERLFRLRGERDERWGVLSPRAVRDLLGWDYRDLTPLAEGGEALVFRGRDRTSGQAVALKVLHPRHLEDPDSLARFRGEAEALASLSLPGVPALLRVERGRLPYLVLSLLPGAAPPAGAPAATRRSWMEALVDLVGRVHAAGWVHRDLHPGNLVVAEDGSLGLLDFGLAARCGQEGPAGGTPGFVSPEQAAGAPAAPAQDVYSLGAVARALGDWEGAAAEAFSRCLAAEAEARPGLEQLAAALRAG